MLHDNVALVSVVAQLLENKSGQKFLICQLQSLTFDVELTSLLRRRRIVLEDIYIITNNFLCID